MHDTPATTDDDQRPSWSCQLHRPPADEHTPWMPADPSYLTCSGCLNRVRATLNDIRDRYHRLDTTPGSSGEHGSRGAPGFRSQPPANLHIIAMRDPRSSRTARTWIAGDGRIHHEHERPPLSVRSELDTICWDIAEHRDTPGPDPHLDVDALTRWIDVHLDWVTRHPLVVDVDQQLRQVRAQLRPVTGDPSRRTIGLCPNTVDEGTTTRVCGTRLYVPHHGDTIECTACDRAWPRAEWLRLGDLLKDAS